MLIPDYKKKIGSRLFKRTDPRREFVNERWDPRINFAFCHGTVGSVGSVHVFEGINDLNHTLNRCCESFLRSQLKVHLVLAERRVPENGGRGYNEPARMVFLYPPKLCDAFRDDFGSTNIRILEWLMPHLPLSLQMELRKTWQKLQPAKRRFTVTGRSISPFISFQPFDFSFYYDVAVEEEPSSSKQRCQCDKGDSYQSPKLYTIDLQAIFRSDTLTTGSLQVVSGPVEFYSAVERQWFARVHDVDALARLIVPNERLQLRENPLHVVINAFSDSVERDRNVGEYTDDCNLPEASGLLDVCTFICALYHLVVASSFLRDPASPLACSAIVGNGPNGVILDDDDDGGADPEHKTQIRITVPLLQTALSPHYNLLRLLEWRVFYNIAKHTLNWYNKRHSKEAQELIRCRERSQSLTLRQLCVDEQFLLEEGREGCQAMPYQSVINVANSIGLETAPSLCLQVLVQMLDEVQNCLKVFNAKYNLEETSCLTADIIAQIVAYVLSKTNTSSLKRVIALSHILQDYVDGCCTLDSPGLFRSYYSYMCNGPHGNALATLQVGMMIFMDVMRKR